jgi:Translation initiation factor IF-2, N-terminal region
MPTVRDLAGDLEIPMPEIIKALMESGYMKTANQPLSEAELQIVTARFGTPPPSAKPDEGPGDGGVREPRRPRPSAPSAEAVSLPKDE